MKLLVTGGCGFIGSNFIRHWLTTHKEDLIINIDKLTYAGHLSSTKDFSQNKRYTHVHADICDSRIVDDTMPGVDYVVHFAAESHVDRSIEGPGIFVQTNVLGTQVLLEHALKHHVKRFHHVSTDEVFGTLDLASDDKFSEKTPYSPRSPYAASKAASDHLVRAYHETYGLDVTITNTSNNFGPFQDPEKFLPRAITNLIEGKQIAIYGDGLNVRDWLYVGDHVRAIEKVLLHATSGSTYLVGGLTRDIPNKDIASILLRAFGKDETYIKYVQDRKGHDRRYSVDWSLLHKELSWKPEFEFEAWLTQTIEWYKNNEWWWKPLKDEAEKLYERTNQR